MKRLSELDIGEWGIVRSVTGKATLRRRLATMGFIPGVAVAVKHCAPMGDPRAYELLGYCLSLRQEEADLIEVEPLPVYPLSTAPPGKVKVVGIEGARGVRAKLAQLGITENTSLVNRATPAGPVIIELSGKELQLGRGVAKKVKVTVIPEENGKATD